jgi:putative tricarboxylic transport membrane protein
VTAGETGSATTERGSVRPGLTLSLAPSLVGVVGGVLYLAAALDLNAGTLAKPGPGIFPLLVAAIVLVPSAICLVTEYLRPSKPPEAVGPAFWRVPTATVAILAYVLLLKPVGFVPAAAVLCGALLWTLGRRPWWLVSLIAIGASLFCYLLFQQLNVYMPNGMMPF